MQCLGWHFIPMSGKNPTKLEVMSRHDNSCLLGRKVSEQTNKTFTPFEEGSPCNAGLILWALQRLGSGCIGYGECGGLVVKRRTRKQEVGGLKPTSAVARAVS